MARIAQGVVRGTVSCVLCLLPGLALATDPPDSAVNPRDGAIETADSSWAGSNFSVRHTINSGRGRAPIVFEVSTEQAEDPEPRLAVNANGDTWVTWWQHTPTSQVFIRKRAYSTGAWSNSRLVSESGEIGTHARIAHDGTTPWVAYLAPVPGGTVVETVQIIDDGPDPFGPLGIATTSYTGDLDLQINAEAGHLWVTWVDGAANVGWCAYDYGTSTWGPPSYEPYVGDAIVATRSRIRTAVLAE